MLGKLGQPCLRYSRAPAGACARLLLPAEAAAGAASAKSPSGCSGAGCLGCKQTLPEFHCKQQLLGSNKEAPAVVSVWAEPRPSWAPPLQASSHGGVLAAGVCAQDAAQTLLHVVPLGADSCCARGVQGVPTGVRACTRAPAPWGGSGVPQAAGLRCRCCSQLGHGPCQHILGRDRGDMAGTRGLGCKELLPGCLCLAAAGFDSWYSPPFSGVTLGSALRMRRPRRRKTPGLMVLPGMLCMSGAELGLGLKSVVGVPEVPGQLKLGCCGSWLCCGQEGQEEGQFPESAGAPPAIPLISAQALLWGQGDLRGWGG